MIGASIDVATAGRHGETVVALLSRSDVALYQAKVFRGGYVLGGDLPAPAMAEAEESPARSHAA